MQITPEQIRETLESLGYSLTDQGNCWRTSALYRQGVNPASITIWKDSGVWNDYGANTPPRPFSELVKLSGGDGVFVEQDPNAPKIRIDDCDKNQPERIFPDSILARLLPHFKPYLDKNIPIQVLKRLKSGLATSGAFYQRFTFPILNANGQIVGFSGRDVSGKVDSNRPKWKHQGKKKNWIYPLYFKDEVGELFVREAILKTREVIIVESIGDCLSLHAKGIYNVLVAFGLSISDAMICKLIELEPERIYVSFNNDSQKGFNSGRNAAIENFLKLLPYFDPENVSILLPLANDFGEQTDDQHKKWLEKKKTFDYERQRDYICENVEKFVNDGWINKKSLKYVKYLGC